MSSSPVAQKSKVLDAKFRDVIQNLENTHLSSIEALYPCLIFTTCCREMDDEPHNHHHHNKLQQNIQHVLSLWAQWKPTSSSSHDEILAGLDKSMPMPAFPCLDSERCDGVDLSTQVVFKQHLDRIIQIANSMQQTCTSWWNLASQVYEMIFASLRNVGYILSFQYNILWNQLHVKSQELYLSECKLSLDEFWKIWLSHKEKLALHGKQLYTRWFAHVTPCLNKMKSVTKVAQTLCEEALHQPDGELNFELEALCRSLSVIQSNAEAMHTATSSFWTGSLSPVLPSLLLSAEKWWNDFYKWFLHLVKISQKQSMEKQAEIKAQQDDSQSHLQVLLQKMQHFELKTPLELNQDQNNKQEAMDAKEASAWLRSEIKLRAPSTIDGSSVSWPGLKLLLQGCRDISKLKVDESHKVFSEMQNLYQGWEVMCKEREGTIKKLIHSQDYKDGSAESIPGFSWVTGIIHGKSFLPKERDPQIVESVNSLNLELDRLKHEMSFVQRQLDQVLIPDYIDKLANARHLQNTLSILEEWVEVGREGWIAMSQEEIVYLQNCLDIRFRLFEGFQDAQNAFINGVRDENRIKKNAIRLFIQHLFVQHLERHDLLLAQLDNVWKATHKKMKDLASLSHKINSQISNTCPLFSAKILDFNTKVGQTMDAIQQNLERNYVAGFNGAVYEHCRAVQHFIQSISKPSHALQKMVMWMDQICDSQHAARNHSSQLLLQNSSEITRKPTLLPLK